MSSDDNNLSESFGANDWLIEEMREKYHADPNSVNSHWRDFFDSESKTLTAEKSSSPVTILDKKLANTVESTNSTVKSKTSGTEKPAPIIEHRRTKGPEKPATPGAAGGLSANPPKATVRTESLSKGATYTVLRGAPMRTAKNMEVSLSVPTATSVRSIPMKLVIDQRTIINNFLRRSKGGKISFTHLIAYAMVQAIKAVPAMNYTYEVIDGKPNSISHADINLGIAIDVLKPNGTRQLLVPNIKNCEDLNFAEFWSAYENIVIKARNSQLTVEDFANTTVSLTNPGGIGTNHSVPRLMPSQGMILGVGSIDYPAEFQGTNLATINELGVSKITTLTSTYDHRVIQGAQSGEFLKKIHELLLGENNFYEKIFTALRVPYAPLHWKTDFSTRRENQVPKSARVLQLIDAFRRSGHLLADTDPLEYRQRSHPDLILENHELSLWDLDREFAVGRFGGRDSAYHTLREIMNTLHDSYCHTIGIEYMHISDPIQREWFQTRMEKPHESLTREQHLRLLDRLNEAEVFETFLQTKFVGQKRFSLEGAESVIVLLSEICESAADKNLDEICIGMPHRGRLNVLTNIAGKKYGQIFREFEGKLTSVADGNTGDVKYHLGSEGKYTAANGKTIKTSVAANPSHLEAVDPALEGIARAKLDKINAYDRYPVLPVLLHGDASFCGQGVVFETLQMSQLRGYKTGGTIHIVVNNQIGFTTSPIDSRTSTYCTDVAKTIAAPVLHVNGDDPDACSIAARLAFDYRERFQKDVVIDIVCYRRRGHNEGDDPSFTQPHMYDLIEQKRSVRRIYAESLIGRGDISLQDAEDVMNKFRDRLENVFKEVRQPSYEPEDEYQTAPFYPRKPEHQLETETTPEIMKAIAAVHTEFPEGLQVHPKVRAQLEKRTHAILEGPIDWATAEIIAFGSLLMDGRQVRVSGQDTRRGTFSQRFASVVDRLTNDSWVPLKHLSKDQARFDIYDSLLSEYAVMGFEYGYSVAAPEALVCWEAQFGDFANTAQTISDEFISAGHAKWNQKSGVVLLLPHGYEGQGPDHSSARIERWLQLCSKGALAVCQPSTPASYFHLLRQHAYVNWHRPVVIITPKSMLRNKLAVSQPNEFTTGRWLPALGDPLITDPEKVETVILCSGKIRWELVAKRQKLDLNERVAILALERLYPLPTDELAKQLNSYSHVNDIRYVQDEPENQGAWQFMQLYLAEALEPHINRRITLRPFTREASSAPSVGSYKVHLAQEEKLLSAALDLN